MKQVIKIIAMFCLVTTALRSQPVPDFVISDSEGNSHQLSTYLNQGQFVVLEFFHSLATQANALAYDLEQRYEAWGNGEFKVQFLAISLRDFDDNATLQKFKSKYRVSFPHCGVEGGALTNLNEWTDGTYGQIRLLPSFVIISPDSTVVFDVRDNNSLTLLDSLDQILYELGARKPFIVKGQVTMDDSPMQEVQVEADDKENHNNRVVLTNLEGKYIHVFDSMPSDRSILFRPIKNDRHDNGVSTWDIVFTIKHILGQEPFTRIEELIAADINHDDRISAIDVVEMRKLVLGIDTAFKHNTSWRFIPKNYEYPGVDSLFITGFPEDIPIGEVLDKPDKANFIGIKVGDVNGSAEVNLNSTTIETRNREALSYQFLTTSTGQYSIRIILPDEAKQWEGFQFGLNLTEAPLSVSTNLAHWDETFMHYDGLKREWRLSYPYEATSPDAHPYIDLAFADPPSTVELAGHFHSEAYTNQLDVVDLTLKPGNDGQPSIRAFPNPGHDYLQVTWPPEWQNGSIQIADFQGKVWITNSIASLQDNVRIPIVQLPPGMYLLRCQDTTGKLAAIKILKD